MDIAVSNSHILERANRLAVIIAAAAAVIAVTALAGWVFDVPSLSGPLAGAPAMNPVTALCVLIAAFSLYAARAGVEPRLARTGRIAAITLGAIASVRLITFATGLPFPFNDVMFRTSAAGGPIPLAMSPNTSLGLLLLAGGLLAQRGRAAGAWTFGKVLLTASLGLALVGVLGYLYGAPPMYGITRTAAMAPNTAVAILLLALGTIASRADSTLARMLFGAGVGGVLGRRMLPVAILTPIVLGWLRLAARRAGWIGPELSSALLALGLVATFVVVVSITARALERLDVERRAALDSAEQDGRFLDSVIEHLPHMVFVKDAETLRFVRFNRAGEHLLGMMRHELVGKNDYDFFPASEADFFTAKDRAVLRSKERMLIPEEPIETRHRGQRLLRTTKVPILNREGKPLYLLGISEDITEARTAEKRVEELNKYLSRYTARLEEAHAEMEAFSYSVSHDLRAPLRHIDGFSDLLQRHAGPRLDDKGRHYIEVISGAAKGMGRLIDDLLNFSRMGRSAMHPGAVDMNALVHEVRTAHEREQGGRKVEWNIAPMPEVQGDRALLRVVLMNLVSNALKYSSTRDASVITVTAECGETETVVCVRDNGVGFDMKYAHKLFGVFQRLHSKESFEGTGIGLANVRRVVQRHGGRTWAEGAVDQGAAFYFALPNQATIATDQTDDRFEEAA